MSESSVIRRSIDDFRLSTIRVSDRINDAGDIWKDSKYISLHRQMGELAKASKAVIESGDRTCKSIDNFTVIANERI